MKKNSNITKENDVVLWVNITLIGMASLLFLYYIMMSNAVASKSYKVQVLLDEIESLSEINTSLMTEKLIVESPAKLMEYVKNKQLVEAGNISYIFEKKSVALQ